MRSLILFFSLSVPFMKEEYNYLQEFDPFSHSTKGMKRGVSKKCLFFKRSEKVGRADAGGQDGFPKYSKNSLSRKGRLEITQTDCTSDDITRAPAEGERGPFFWKKSVVCMFLLRIHQRVFKR